MSKKIKLEDLSKEELIELVNKQKKELVSANAKIRGLILTKDNHTNSSDAVPVSSRIHQM